VRKDVKEGARETASKEQQEMFPRRELFHWKWGGRNCSERVNGEGTKRPLSLHRRPMKTRGKKEEPKMGEEGKCTAPEQPSRNKGNSRETLSSLPSGFYHR